MEYCSSPADKHLEQQDEDNSVVQLDRLAVVRALALALALVAVEVLAAAALVADSNSVEFGNYLVESVDMDFEPVHSYWVALDSLNLDLDNLDLVHIEVAAVDHRCTYRFDASLAFRGSLILVHSMLCQIFYT